MSTNRAPGGRSDDPDDVPVPDEEWAELVRLAEAGSAGAPKEPSARARMVTARLRALDEEAARAGGRRKGGRRGGPPEPWQPDGWRTGPDTRGRGSRSTRRRRIAGTLGFLVVVGILLVAMRPSLVTDILPGADTTVDTLPLPAESAPPTGAPAGGDLERPTLAQPFRGSPALRWADGAEGIETPEAEAVGGMSRAEVEQALRATRQLLVTANLDPATLRGEKPREALGLLDPLQEGEPERLEKALAEPGEEQDPLMLFTRFDPDGALLVGEVVKTRGRMTFEAGAAGSVEVHADYTFVYPLVKPDGDEVARTIVRRRLTTALHDPQRFAATRGKLSVVRSEQNFANTACETYDGFLHPSFPSDGPEPQPEGPEVDPYDRSTWQPDGSCGTLTRT
ncbi:hypothetical protein [Streptomyces sp. NBC_01185]|uniref:hypothetical protein n=1 Tax=Streptomyces sp. NBC_01185 TaxID=2903764 RepID=UPI003870AF00|nr:hypothetical protein OG770_14920 [Streptomyces sp. NBC_01185]